VPTEREVEVKLTAPSDLGPARLLESIAATPGVGRVGEPSVVQLDATYYDTADLRLARSLVTLRRREGGADQGWHLKLPGEGFRTEITEPLTDDVTPPAALAILVGAFVRGQKLAPVARIRTTRTAFEVFGAGGERLAEVADDDVRSESFGPITQLSAWREIEVELKDAAPGETLQILEKSLIAAGARRSVDVSKLRRALGDRLPEAHAPAGASVKRPCGRAVISNYLAAQAAALLRADPAVRADLPDAVHSARVAIRRIRSGVRVFADVLAAPPADLDERLSALSNVLGRARDAEVQRDRLDAAVAALPAELVLGPVVARILEEALPDAIEARRVLLETLQTPAYYALLDDLLSYVAAASGNTPGKRKSRSAAVELLPAIRKAHRQLSRRADAALRGDDDTALHQTRKAAKRLRYAAESVETVYGAKASRLAREAEEIQEILGDHQDSVVMRERLRSLAVATQGASNESAFTFGLLYGQEIGRAEDTLRQFATVWRKRSKRPGWPTTR
jgi:CHAD domain-containing protein